MTVPSRFGVLRFIAILFKTLAWIALILSLLGALGLGLVEPLARQALLDDEMASLLFEFGNRIGIIFGIGLALSGILTFLTLYALGENIQLQLAIEENTRMAAAVLLKLDEANAPAEQKEYTYSGETYYGQAVDTGR